ANMTASWLAQMAWEVYVVDGATAADFSEAGPWQRPLPALPQNREVDPAELAGWIEAGEVVVIDVAKHAAYRKGHVPGAWYLLRSGLDADVSSLPRASRYVVTSEDGVLAHFAAPQLAAHVSADVVVLRGGTAAWRQAGYDVETGEMHLASEPIDRYRRPYEGTDAPQQAMQAYLDWEFGLVEQLGRDGTHHFRPLTPEDKDKGSSPDNTELTS